ncbi:hypothetical protein HAX54_030004, partial [Datura stramonium]|nr:hypothetical protein [Datura stramonium]
MYVHAIGRLGVSRGSLSRVSIWSYVRVVTRVSLEAAILITCIMTGVPINFGNIMANKMKRKARQLEMLMPYAALISQLCLNAGVPLLPEESPSSATNVINVERKSYAKAPNVKRKRMNGFDAPGGSTSHDIEENPVAPDLN